MTWVALTWAQFPLWTIGNPASVYDGRAFSEHLFNIHNVAFTRILMDQGIYFSIMIFAAGFRHLVRQARPECEWLGTLVFGASIVWLAVTLVADGLEGGAVLDTLQGSADPSTVRALIQSTVLVYNGSIAFAITGLFLAAAGYASMASDIVPRWTAWLAYAGAAICLFSVPAMYGGPVNANGLYNAGGWGPAIIANFPPLFWFLAIGVILIRKRTNQVLRSASATAIDT